MSNQGAAAAVPTSLGRQLRACRGCGLIKTYDQFRESGCENCASVQMKNDHERLIECTTQNFDGIIPVFEDSKMSLTAPWLRIAGRLVRGYYADWVSDDLQNDCEEENVGCSRSKRVRLA